MNSPKTRSITVAALVLTDTKGRVLTVRKRGTEMFMLPGGKFEANESTDAPAITARREFAEELGIELDLSLIDDWGIARDAAANEPGFEVVGHHVRYREPVAEGSELANVSPHAEIEEVRWVDPWLPTGHLAPMLSNSTLPRLRSEQLEHARTQSQLHEPRFVEPQRVLSSATVFCGSGFGKDSLWQETAIELGKELAKHQIDLVYGGAAIGLMGAVADSALADGGKVIGVIPQVLVDKEIAHPGLTRLETVSSMPERKSRMYELGDVFVALPGGAGTLEEFFEVWTQQHLGIHHKPVALLGPKGFWQPLIDLVRHVAGQGFIRDELVDALIVVEEVEQLVPELVHWVSGRTKF